VVACVGVLCKFSSSLIHEIKYMHGTGDEDREGLLWLATVSAGIGPGTNESINFGSNG
jgi:hypothetical protein